MERNYHSDSEESDADERTYDETLQYLMRREYPEGATKQEKGVIRKRAKHFRSKDGQLFRVCKDRNKEEEHLCLVIRDQKVRRQIFEGCHVGPAGNHEGRDRTHAKIQEKYYWPGVTKDVKQWVSWCIAIIVLNMHASAFLVQNDCWHCYQVSIVFIFACGCLLCQVQHCDQCQRTKRKFDRPATQLHPVPVPNYSWKQIGIDLVGPLACTEEGNKYIIVVTDYFTKWPEARAAPTKEAFHVANFLFDLFLRHGCPDITISDQGKEFCNQVNTRM